MNLQQLRYVVAVERTGSITQAARDLYMGQPNLSKAIKELESEIGITIFKRTAKGVEPTRPGLDFLRYAATILAQFDELQSLYQPQAAGNVFKLRVSVPRASYISAAFARFMGEHTDGQLDVRYRETSSMGVVHDVSSGASTIGVLRYQNIYDEYFRGLLRENGLQGELLYEFDMVLLMSRHHPLAGLGEIPYHLLDGYIEIAHGDYQAPPLAFSKIQRDAIMNSGSKRIYVYDRGSQFDLLEQVPGAYMWVSPLPFDVLAQHQLVQKLCTAAAPSRDLIICRDKAMLSPAEQHLVETLHAAAQQQLR